MFLDFCLVSNAEKLGIFGPNLVDLEFPKSLHPIFFDQTKPLFTGDNASFLVNIESLGRLHCRTWTQIIPAHDNQQIGRKNLDHYVLPSRLARWIIGRFARDRYVMDMAFLQTGIGNPDKLRSLAQIF